MDCEELTINVRSPSLPDILVVKASLSHTVLMVKQSLRSVHPYTPDTSSQRLIYAGKLLKDQDVLDNVLHKGHDISVYTFHLVVKPGGLHGAPPTPKPPIKESAVAEKKTEQPPVSPVNENISIAVSPIPTAVSSPMPTPSTSYTTAAGPSRSPLSRAQSTSNSNMESVDEPQIVNIDGKQYLSISPAVQTQIEAYEKYLINYQQYYADWYQWYNTHYVANAANMANHSNSAAPSQPTSTSPNNNLGQEQAAPAGPVNGVEDPEVVRQRAARRAAVVWLGTKLLLALFILTRNASIPRMVFLYSITFAFFLYQTGQLRFIIRRVRPWNARAFTAATPGSGNNNHPINQPITRRRIIERGLYTFVASLFPSYGHDPHIAEALDNAQQDEAMPGF
ncbi:hypothetical protein INT43_006038 [Umbelopsis isabellina]|uniref:Ubiquitin-like domain-containing protein n=1 Tax=Mortierella isabellina TaxID=91625 RepID=A0A8H7PKP5_MORIS|nr:hypothetical protein INT43_006038 [Umbelopsis isabellina]